MWNITKYIHHHHRLLLGRHYGVDRRNRTKMERNEEDERQLNLAQDLLKLHLPRHGSRCVLHRRLPYHNNLERKKKITIAMLDPLYCTKNQMNFASTSSISALNKGLSGDLTIVAKHFVLGATRCRSPATVCGRCYTSPLLLDGLLSLPSMFLTIVSSFCLPFSARRRIGIHKGRK